MLEDNLREVKENIRSACERSGRNPEDVTLIAVSKTHPSSLVQEVYHTGIRDFGENKVQELTEKIPVLPKDITWHMIGHLQRNKVRQIVGKVGLIHSVDSERLLRKIDSESQRLGIVSDVLLQVNIAEEESKYGFTVQEVMTLIDKISEFHNICVRGLMTVAPFVDDPEENRVHFANLRKLSVDIARKKVDNINVTMLSMGMTNDYEIAIEEGATHVRVGTGIFGKRYYDRT